MNAPDFHLQDQIGNWHDLTNYKNSWLILYFYPRDDTPGCTVEACSFRDNSEEFTKRGIKVVGISKDNISSHQKFAKKYDLNFTLLADPEHQIIEQYHSWGKKKFMGREYDGTLRNSFLINPEGEIVKEYQGVDPVNHISEILGDFDQLTVNLAK